jgi:hypothetical protein
MKPFAPAASAEVATALVTMPVMMATAEFGHCATMRFSPSSPCIPGMLRSSSVMSKQPLERTSENASSKLRAVVTSASGSWRSMTALKPSQTSS